VKPILAGALPGDRRVWIAAAVPIAAMLAGILIALSVPRDYYTGTNSVRTRGPVTTLQHGQRLCARGLNVPAGTGRLEFEVGGSPRRPAMTARIRAGRRVTVTTLPARLATGYEKVQFAIPKRPSSPEAAPASACLSVGEGGHIVVGGMAGVQGDDVPPTLNGHELNARVAVWFLPPIGERRALLSLMPRIFERAARFRPGIVGPWTYYLLILAVLPGLIYAVIRLLATTAAGRRGRVGAGATIFVLALINAGAWAVITPAFNAPDESEHFAYAQYFAETGKAIDRHAGGGRDAYSSSETIALEGVRLFSSTEKRDGRPPWLAVDERRWRARTGNDPPRDNGGGYTVAGSAHTPLYYALLAPAYLATRSQSTFSQLTAMRLVSALLGALVALCAFLLVREIVPSQPLLAVGAGAIVAFQPMFGFISGSVNNDMGVNAGAAVLLYLLVRGLRRGLTPPLGLAIGVALALTPLLKGTGYTLYLAAIVAVAAMLYRQRLTRGVLPFIALVAPFAALLVGWHLLSAVFERPSLATPGGTVPAVGSVTSSTHNVLGLLSYLWQTFLPKLPFMSDLTPTYTLPGFETYVVRGWGAFGWYAMEFPRWVYVVIGLAMLAVGALAVLAVWRHRTRVRTHLAEIVTLVAVIGGVILGVETAYYTPKGHTVLPVFGRYAFPAITALAAVAVGSVFAFPRRLRVPAITVLVALVLGLSYASQLLSLSSFYS
jgi:hypothetical protein